MDCDTENQSLKESFEAFMQNIRPKFIAIGDALDRKLIGSPFLEDLQQSKYGILIRGIRQKLEIYRENNVSLITELETMGKQQDAITGAMTIDAEGREVTFSEAMSLLQRSDRNFRKEVYLKKEERLSQDVKQLNDLFSQMLAKRHQVALNAGFSNYRDYKFAEMERFDYTPEDCFRFHKAVRKEIMPLVEEFDKARKSALQVDELKPWDLWTDEQGRPPLKSSEGGEDLLQKTIQVLQTIRPRFADFILQMNSAGRFDLETRKGKAPGGYCCPLFETKVPFIFMNAVGMHDDIRTMTHECGHAIHGFLSNDLELIHSRYPPSEIAELASMTMEMFCMDHWDIFYENESDLIRAKREHLERSLSSLTKIATFDKFQHWVYENPDHSLEERGENWLNISNQYTGSKVNFNGIEHYRKFNWLQVPHVMQMPFYFIEYGFARLGSLAIWRNFKRDKEKALDDYEYALSLGYTRTLPELYEAAGIKFDFSEEYIADLAGFVKDELTKLA